MSHTIQNEWDSWIYRFIAEETARATAAAKAQIEAQIEACVALRAHREDLRLFLEQRFGALPAAIIERIDACDDLNRLQATMLRVPAMQSLDEFQL